MKKITNESAKAFKLSASFNLSNTTVTPRSEGTFFYLHGNMIAHRKENELYITHCGWATNTTKERLNGILDAFNLPRISQKKGVWYYGSEVFEGNKLIQLTEYNFNN